MFSGHSDRDWDRAAGKFGRSHVPQLEFDTTAMLGAIYFLCPTVEVRDMSAPMQVGPLPGTEAAMTGCKDGGHDLELSTPGSNILACALLGRFLRRWLAGEGELLEL